MLLKSFWNSHLKIINGLDPYSRIELVDEREYQKVQMKPTNDEIISERKKKMVHDWTFQKYPENIPWSNFYWKNNWISTS
jgi:hypothetical protein